ncbi:MAG: hypothetical protein ACRD4H_00370, partial [Candidatus Acidiferrales bacterium]
MIAIPAARAQTTARSATKELRIDRIYGEPSLNGETLQGIEWTPDGKHLSYFRSAQDGMDLVVIDAETGLGHVLV